MSAVDSALAVCVFGLARRHALGLSVEHERQRDLRRLVASSKLGALERLADDAERTPPRLRRALPLELRRVSHLVRVTVRVRVRVRVRVLR